MGVFHCAVHLFFNLNSCKYQKMLAKTFCILTESIWVIVQSKPLNFDQNTRKYGPNLNRNNKMSFNKNPAQRSETLVVHLYVTHVQTESLECNRLYFTGLNVQVIFRFL